MTKSLLLRVPSASPLNAIATGREFFYAADSASNILQWSKDAESESKPIRVVTAADSLVTSMNSDGFHLYVGTSYDESAIRIYEPSLDMVRSVPSQSGTVFDIFVGTDYLVTGLTEGMLRIWLIPEMECTHEIKAQEHFALAVAADQERVYAGGIDNCTNIFSMDDGSRLASLTGHDASVFSLAVNDDYVFSGSGEIWWGGPGAPRPSVFESSVRVWSKKDWECVQLIEGHRDNVNSLCVDSTALFSASDDGTVRFYRLADWSQGVIIDLSPTRISCMSQDAARLYLGCSDGSIRVVDKSAFV
jgi:WD40 repeat protein